VINSKRQLWSVGAYLGMVVRNVFGVSTTVEGIALHPFVTARLRGGVFAGSDSVSLNNLRLQDRVLSLTLRLPAAEKANDGVYAVERILLNGKPSSSAIKWTELGPENRIEIVLGKLQPGEQAIRRVNADPYVESPAVFSPHEPVIADLKPDAKGRATVLIEGKDGDKVRYNIYRDGKLVAAKLPAGAWVDRKAGATACYAVEAQFLASGNRSHHSRPRCLDAGVDIPVTDSRVSAGVPLAAPNARFDEPHLANWGKPQDVFTVRDVRVPAAGTQSAKYAVQIRYHNGANQINLGISGGVKWLAVKDESGAIVAQGVVQLPHARIEKAHTPTVYSTPLTVELKGSGAYRIEMSDFYNMSYLQSNSTFSAAGGLDGPSNRFDIYGVRLLRVH
jgi:hypothetical protein